MNNRGKTISKNIAVDDIANICPNRFISNDVVGSDLRSDLGVRKDNALDEDGDDFWCADAPSMGLMGRDDESPVE